MAAIAGGCAAAIAVESGLGERSREQATPPTSTTAEHIRMMRMVNPLEGVMYRVRRAEQLPPARSTELAHLVAARERSSTRRLPDVVARGHRVHLIHAVPREPFEL